MKPIAILFANLKGNLGDFAILQAMLEDLQRRFPGHPLHVFAHPFTAINETDLKLFRLGAPPFELVDRSFSIRFPFFIKWLTRMPSLWKSIQARYVQKLVRQADEDAEQFADYLCVVMAGGDQYGGSNPGTTMFGTIKAIAVHNHNIYAYPFSLAPAALKLNARKDLADYFNTLAQPVVVRDAMTEALLRKCGLKPVLGVDCVFGLRELATVIQPAPGRARERVLLVVTGRKDSAEASLREVIGKLKAENIPLALMSTSPPEDSPLFSRLGEEFGIPVHMPGSWQEAVAELKASSLIVTNRLHAMILGSFGEAAMLPIADRPKAAAFARDAGLPHMAATPADVTPALVRQVLEDRTAVSAALRTYGESKSRALSHPVFSDLL